MSIEQRPCAPTTGLLGSGAPRPQGATRDLVLRAARLYRQKVWDWGESRGTGVGIVNGSGGVMALMDMCPTLRWGWLLETPQGTEQERSFAQVLAYVVDAAVGWCFFGWDLDDPDNWRAVLKEFPPERVIAYCDGPELDAWQRAYALADVPEMVERVQMEARCRF